MQYYKIIYDGYRKKHDINEQQRKQQQQQLTDDLELNESDDKSRDNISGDNQIAQIFDVDFMVYFLQPNKLFRLGTKIFRH